MTENKQTIRKLFDDRKSFNEYYHKFIAPALRISEEKRKIALSFYCATYGLAALWIYLIVAITKSVEVIDFVLPIIAISLFLAEGIKNRYKRKTKESILNILFAFLGEFRYKEVDKEITAKYKENLMYPRYNRGPYIDDYIVGKYKDLPVEIAELTLDERRGTGKHSQVVTVFRGILLSFPQIKTTTASTITRNRAYSSPTNKGEKVILEDVEYENLYETSSNDQIEARYIFTPVFMEKMKDLARKRIKVALCFDKGEIYVAIQTRHDMFEPPFFTTALNPRAYKNILLELQEVLSVIDILQLDSKPKL